MHRSLTVMTWLTRFFLVGALVVVPVRTPQARLPAGEIQIESKPANEPIDFAHVDLVRRWIDLDLPWEDGFAFGKLSRQAPLAPRRPEVPGGPAVAKLSNPIDRFLHGYFTQLRRH